MITIHPQRNKGLVKPVHGVNRGPIDDNWYFDYRDWFRRWRIPMVRTHDLAFNAYDTCDLHHLFPDPQADPDDPANYRFALTDDVLQAIRDTGAEIYFRLGESIEHQPRMVWNRPERWTPEKIARVCVNITRHYNQGWADGFEWGIRYWEFWNEPNGPKNWTGAVDQFFELYHAVAKAIKSHDPSLRIGLAGLSSGILDSDQQPTRPWRDGLENCVKRNIPIDFVSWHRYIDRLDQIPASALATRRYLDSIGLSDAESHLGEWAYRAMFQTDRKSISFFTTRNLKRYDLMTHVGEIQRGSHAAAVIFATFAQLQDLPVDLSQYYCADSWYGFGLFTEFGLPNKRAMAFEAFLPFLDQQRVEAACPRPEVVALAVSDPPAQRLRIGIANTDPRLIEIPLTIPDAAPGWTVKRMTVLDEQHDWQTVMPPAFDESGRTLTLPICGAGLIVLELSRPGAADPPAAHPSSAGITPSAPGDKPPGDW